MMDRRKSPLVVVQEVLPQTIERGMLRSRIAAILLLLSLSLSLSNKRKLVFVQGRPIRFFLTKKLAPRQRYKKRSFLFLPLKTYSRLTIVEEQDSSKSRWGLSWAAQADPVACICFSYS